MSRIGRRPIDLPENTQVNIQKEEIMVKGPKGEIVIANNPSLRVKQENNKITIKRERADKKTRAMHGLIRSLLSNAVIGVNKGFTKELELVGVGFRARLEGEALVLSVGFSHPVKIEPPEGIKFAVAKNTKIEVSGIDKQAVGEIAAKIRKVRPPEPYKGKGVRYRGEIVRKKAGKAAKTVGIGGQ